MDNIENLTNELKLYSTRSITLATFLGGPLAAGYLISENFKSLKQTRQARISLITGIVATILLFSGVFLIPEKIVDKIPNQLIPLISVGLVWAIVEWTHGDILKSHKENSNQFFSGWRAAGIGTISLIIIGSVIFSYIYIESNNPAYEIYDSEITEFSKNETESLEFYTNVNIKDNSALLKELDKIAIPNWEKNITIIKELNDVNDLPRDLLDQNKSLLTYSLLRLEAFKLTKKAILENSDKYESQLNLLYSQIDKELVKLN